MNPPVRVLLVDDHAVVLEGLRLFLETHDDIEVVGTAADGERALAEARRLQPHVILMDLVMPGVDGIEATRRVRRELPQVAVIALTSFGEESRVVEGVRAGAQGYLLKSVAPARLVEAVRAARAGEAVMDPQATRALLERVRERRVGPEQVEHLTRRELEVLQLLAQGLSNRETSERLAISEKTVKTHVSSILGKLGVEDRTQAVLHALRRGLVALEHGDAREAAEPD